MTGGAQPTSVQNMATKNCIHVLGVPVVLMIGTLPSSMSVDIAMCTHPSNKTVVNNKIWVVGICAECGSGE